MLPKLIQSAELWRHEAKSDPHPQYAKQGDLVVLEARLNRTGVGRKGDPGEDGQDGRDGVDGLDGVDGTNLGVIDGGFANSTYGSGGLIDCGGA